MSRDSALRHLPNALSGLRLAAALPVAWLIGQGADDWALALFVLGAASDALDGWLARRYGWQSRIGGWLDPVADKAFVLAASVALALRGELHWALLILMAVRDSVIVGGALAFHLSVAALRAAPTWLGKLTTLVLLLLITGLLAQNAGVPLPELVTDALTGLGILLIVLSGADYVLRWAAKTRAMKRRGSRRAEEA
jgi:cardiolipin synthase